MEKTVHYCCVSKGNRASYVYSRGDEEIEQLAQLCLGNAPLYHRWYFETIGKRTFGFLMEDGFVYLAIVDEGLRNSSLLRFLEYVRDEFKKVTRKGSRGGSFSGLNSILQEQLVPVISQLINSLEHIASRGHEWNGLLSPSTNGGQIELANCTKAPLLGKQDKKKSKDHVIVAIDEQKKSTDHRGVIIKCSSESTAQDPTGSPQQKDSVSTRNIRPNSQTIRKKWWRQVKIVLAIDLVVCLVLFGIWLSICGGFGCIR